MRRLHHRRKHLSRARSRGNWSKLFSVRATEDASHQALVALPLESGRSRRAGFYRSRRPRQASPVDMEIRDEMQKVAVESPACGYRRITAEL